MAHTPGPWTLERREPGDKEIRVKQAPIYIDYDDVDHKEQRANAKLVAAAPQLLESLQALLKAAGDFLQDEAGLKATAMAQAAVKKAI